MSDSFGIDLPVPLSGASIAGDANMGKADPAAHKILAFVVAVLRDRAAAEWAALRPRPAGDVEGVNVARKAFVGDPTRALLEQDDLPALFLWRARGRQEDATFEHRHETASFSLLWVLPPDEPRKEALREPIAQALMKALGAAFAENRHPAWWDDDDDDIKAPTLAADDDAIVLAAATSTSAVSLSGAGLDGAVGGATMAPRRGLTVTTTAAAGAYNADDPIVVTYVDWRGQEQVGSLTIAENGGETVLGTFEAARVTSIDIPAQQLETGAIRIGLQARAGRGSSIAKAARMMSLGLTEWAPHTLGIDIMDPKGNVERTAKYFGALATIQGVEQHLRDPAVRAWPLATPPAGLDVDITIDGEDVTRAEL